MNVKSIKGSTLKLSDIQEARKKLETLSYEQLESYKSYDMDQIYKQMYIDRLSMPSFEIKTIKQRNVAKLNNRVFTSFDFSDVRATPLAQLTEKTDRVAAAKVARHKAIESKTIAGSTSQGIVVMALGAVMMFGGIVMMLAM